ncbi:MAG: aminotransferase class I/II-fold pyridoxal phosphate-dependent enzyme [Acidobacteria bacterium]|uniref:Aminotransferase class I/II-fold pyridoxal phosphate-dependent enzyme n=1 Tax=Candidatus Polarisedimenticola svalbardensis TaxID=2886004 RepID=A0A8J6Y5L6_9BACT|nr:aminotransferase class I/II-fold pyridoxal phosphate-dependent enzyme [Candidatus Polarisedimenticola svalbardensis]
MATNTRTNELSFGEPEQFASSFSSLSKGLKGSRILQIAGQVRELIAAGETVYNLTVGDFDPSMFPIPAGYKDRIKAALDDGQTTYPPADGMPELRAAVAEYASRVWNVPFQPVNAIIGGGARPMIFATYKALINPGEKVVYPVPSWNNHYYTTIADANVAQLETVPENGFMPTLDDLAPHMKDARLLVLNTPSNPTGTVIDPEMLRAITQGIVDENLRRAEKDQPRLFLLMDMVYHALVFGDHRHVHPLELVPAAAPWVISLDAVSKGFCGTGVRVGWGLAAPAVIAKLKPLISHMGAWAPRAEQVALAGFLRDREAVESFQDHLVAGVGERLDTLYKGFADMKADGYPVECIAPEGAVFLSLRLNWIGKNMDGKAMESNEDIRTLLLEKSGMAVVPFQAFGRAAEDGWFRMSVGAVTSDNIRGMFPKVRALMDGMR